MSATISEFSRKRTDFFGNRFADDAAARQST